MDGIYQRDDWRELETHPAAEMFGLMAEGTLNEAAEAMKLRGYDRSEPIILHAGRILDGRSRRRMCLLSGVEPWFIDDDSELPWDVAYQKNSLRRDQDLSQRAMSKALYMRHLEDEGLKRKREGGKKGAEVRWDVIQTRHAIDEPQERHWTADKAAGKEAGTGESLITRAKQIIKEKPELVAAVLAGEQKVGTIYHNLLRKPRAPKTAPAPLKMSRSGIKQRERQMAQDAKKWIEATPQRSGEYACRTDRYSALDSNTKRETVIANEPVTAALALANHFDKNGMAELFRALKPYLLSETIKVILRIYTEGGNTHVGTALELYQYA